MKSTVVIIGCKSYDDKNLLPAVRQGIELLGGISKFAQKGEKIILKPNLLVGDDPEKSITTHPGVFKAVAQVFLESGAELSYGDSPALARLERAAQTAGIKRIADELGIPAADFKTPVQISFPEALLARQIQLAADAVSADGIISLPKMKTHGFTRITGAVKNQFGCVPGLQKGEFHFKMPDVRDFARILVDINRILKMRLFIMDGIVAMEGNGPRGGKPVPMNVLLFSTDPVALDSVFCRLIALNPSFVPTMEPGELSGLGTWKESEIELKGDPIEPFINPNFKVVRDIPHPLASAKSFPTFLKQWVSPRPLINSSLCQNCGECTAICPVDPKAVYFPDSDSIKKRKVPVYDYNRCIRCYCCQEICPAQAITIKTPLLGKIIRKF